jgi:hypothetical protein
MAFYSHCTNFYSHQQCIKGPCFSKSSLAFVVTIALEYGHSKCCEMKSKCFDLHLFYKQGSQTLFHVFIRLLYLFP